jgi:hypothetical protein
MNYKEGYSVNNNNAATSLPGSRSHSPIIEQVESVEVVTKSCAEREGLYDLSTLINDDDNIEVDGKKKKKKEEEQYRATADETVTPETQLMSTTSHSSDDDDDVIEVIEESVSHETAALETGVKVIGLGFITQMAGK